MTTAIGDENDLRHGLRSLASLKQLAPLWQVPGVAFISVQKGQAVDEAMAPPKGQPLLDLALASRTLAI